MTFAYVRTQSKAPTTRERSFQGPTAHEGTAYKNPDPEKQGEDTIEKSVADKPGSADSQIDKLARNQNHDPTTTSRRSLRQALEAIPPKLFAEVAAQVQSGRSPGRSCEAFSARTLLSWAESPEGAGLETLKQVLARVINQHLALAQVSIQFVSSASESASAQTAEPFTLELVNVFVRHLRKELGDPSIEVAFFKQGSPNTILRGSPTGLKQLAAQFHSGQLEALEIPTVVPAVRSVKLLREMPLAEIQEKSLLVKALRVREQFLTTSGLRERMRARARANALLRVRELTLARTLLRDLQQSQQADAQVTFELRGDWGEDWEIAQESAYSIDLEIDLAHGMALQRALARALLRTRNAAIARYIRLARWLAHPYLKARRRHWSAALSRKRSARSLSLRLGLEQAIAPLLAFTLGKALRLSMSRALSLTPSEPPLNLARADLQNANLGNLNLVEADLSGANLIGADLSGADLTGADLTGAVFGNNLGLEPLDISELQQRGARLSVHAGLEGYRSGALHGL